jgi:hypothetical protein
MSQKYINTLCLIIADSLDLLWNEVAVLAGNRFAASALNRGTLSSPAHK